MAVLYTYKEPNIPPGAPFGRPMGSSGHSWTCLVIYVTSGFVPKSGFLLRVSSG